jgi:2,3-bisphosphoglycerate-independent phosphoglycerate mutase
MSEFEFIQRMIVPNDTKIVMLILDGLGGLPRTPDGLTELETAKRPNMNALAKRASLGLTIPVVPGITPGSGPGHLAIFGYDPLVHEIGRGALEALGIDFDLRPEDVAARGNFCTLAPDGTVADRRAGRLSTPEAMRAAKILNNLSVDGAQVFVESVKEHRFALVLRGAGLGANVSETDPLKAGEAPLLAKGRDGASQKTAAIVNEFMEKAREALADEPLANGILLRGFDKLPVLPTFQELYQLNPAAIAINGMYKGVARLAGMQILPVIGGTTITDEIATLEEYWKEYDFFYVHVKQTDTAGEDGDFDRKVRVIEEVDALLPRITALNPDVFIISGDHSSPAVLKFHSWHPVPTLLYSPHARPDGIAEFGERACLHGSLGILPAKQVMPLALGYAHRFAKYGA